MNTKNSKRSSSAEPAYDRTIDLDLLVDDPKTDLPTVAAMMTPAQRSRDNILHLRATQRKPYNRESKTLNLTSLSLKHKIRMVFKTPTYLSVHPRRLLCRNLLDLTVFSLSLNALLTLPTDKS